MRGAVVGAVISAAVGLAACGGSDTPGLSGAAPVASTPTTATGGGPAVKVTALGAVEAPVIVAGAPGAAATATARGIAAGLGGRTCPVRVVASTPKVVSLRWDCTDRTVATATFAVATGRQLQLGDVLQGPWVAYLSSTAQAQLVAGGSSAAAAAAAAPTSPAAYDRWNLTGAELQVVLAGATLSFPLATLGAYLRPGIT